MSEQQPPWGPKHRQESPPDGQHPQYPSQPPYGRQQDQQYDQPQPTGPYPGQAPYPGQVPYQRQPYGPPGGRPAYPGQQPRSAPAAGHAKESWPARHKVLTALLGVVALFVAGGLGAAAAGGGRAATAAPAPTVTVTEVQHDPGATVTVTATPTANAQGEATQISADGVYVVGTDIPGGTWHTSGGSQCYEATLGSTDTSNIIDNNNFTGPDTVSLAGAKAFDINGGCTWQHEG